ncbi:MAG: hypothetical protein ACRCXZ_04110 [Patescibacteria group bacterium]
MISNSFKEKFFQMMFSRSTIVSTFLIYITILFISVISFIEFKGYISNSISLYFLVILEVYIIINFFSSYLTVYNSVKNGKWINLSFNSLAFVGCLTILYQTLSVLVNGSYSYANYSYLLVSVNFLLFLQNYFDDRKAKGWFLFGLIISILFAMYIYIINNIFGNPVFGPNYFVLSQKQQDDTMIFFSTSYLIYSIVLLFNFIRIYISDIKAIDQIQN